MRRRATTIAPRGSDWHARVKVQCAQSALVKLREARDDLVAGACPAAADYVRRAIKSAEGALRHAHGLESRQYYTNRRIEDAAERESVVMASGRVVRA